MAKIWGNQTIIALCFTLAVCNSHAAKPVIETKDYEGIRNLPTMLMITQKNNTLIAQTPDKKLNFVHKLNGNIEYNAEKEAKSFTLIARNAPLNSEKPSVEDYLNFASVCNYKKTALYLDLPKSLDALILSEISVVAENGQTMLINLQEKDNFAASKNGGYNSLFESTNEKDILSLFEFLAKNGKAHLEYRYLKSQTPLVTKIRDIPMFEDNADVFNSYIQSCKQEKTVIVIDGKEQ